MKLKIETRLPEHILKNSNASNIYIVDFKDLNIGDVELLESEPVNIKYVHLENKVPISVWFDGFKNNALPLTVGSHNKQCECVIFPESCNETDWVLFIEMKYANDLKNAFREVRNYPNGMIEQIIETVSYFREKGIIDIDKRVNAIVSFPNLIEEFNSVFFTNTPSIDEILNEYKILIRATNFAIIKSEKRISLIS